MIENFEIKFGTSGFRGRWAIEFKEERVKWVAQAICDDLKDIGLAGKSIVLGYDSRIHADQVAKWCAEVILANGYNLHFTSRDTPTPVLVYYGLEVLGESQLAGIINCTASHNPKEWHGIKFSPRNGCPAPPDVTSRVEALANSYQSNNRNIHSSNLDEAEAEGQLLYIDPIDSYCEWILNSGIGDNRIKLNLSAIKDYFSNKLVIIDEMHGTGREYLRKLLDEIGVSYEVMHGERDPNLGELHAANPEIPYINPLIDRVKSSEAALGIGLDTDADRYGVIDAGGIFTTPNQILAMLTHYLGVDRKIGGRVAISHVSTKLVETVAGAIAGNEQNKPAPNTLPPYLSDPAYEVVAGDRKLVSSNHAFTVPVGLKYIVEIPQMDQEYRMLDVTPEDWRDRLLIGGEEASGLTTKGHVPDKDGIWAALLIMDMMAFYQKSLAEIWEMISERYWPSHTIRLNLDVPDDAKSKFINYFLDAFAKPNPKLGEFNVTYAGGQRNKLIELRLKDAQGQEQYYVQSRPSGTEPLIRLYIEGMSEESMKEIERSMREILDSVLTAQN